jgi:hypothetical protein
MMAKQEAAPEVAAPTVALTFDQLKELIAAVASSSTTFRSAMPPALN